MKIIAYKQTSESAKALALALGVKRINHEGNRIRIKDTLINWGASALPDRIDADNIINKPAAITLASNKLQAFIAMMDTVETPAFTASSAIAHGWLTDGKTVVARTKLNGHSGEGIEIMDPERFKQNPDGVFVHAPLYTEYVKKVQEYRIHVHNGKAFFVQRKARDKDVPDEDVNWQIRNHANGFIYANKDVEVSDEAKQQAVAACAALGLDFGAVDIIQCRNGPEWVVLEVNTAPGLSGATLEKYVEQFKDYK